MNYTKDISKDYFYKDLKLEKCVSITKYENIRQKGNFFRQKQTKR